VSGVEASLGARAGFVSRLAAFFVDAAVLAVAIRSVAWLLRATAQALGRLAPPLNARAALVALVPAIVVAYQLLFWTMGGQTPGKWLLGLRVVVARDRPTPLRVAEDGAGLTLARASLRLLGYVLSAMPLYAGFLAVLGPKRRAWHDRIAGTEVVFVASPRATPVKRAGRASASAPPGSGRERPATATPRARAT
jgi:uncharacterized RDD family membrane protein YckC